MEMKKIIKSWFLPDGSEVIKTPLNQEAKFTLYVDELIIGHLTLQKGVWEFKYSEDFIKQDIIKPLTDFPDKHKTYQTEVLWPFFSYRIPGLSQPQVQKVIKNRKINQNNIVELLTEFGQKTIANPFILLPA